MTQDNMLDVPDVHYDHANFKAHWEELEKPVCEILEFSGAMWRELSYPAFYSDSRYRIKNDPNWELRERWLASGRKLQLELWDAEDHIWDSVTGMHRIGDVKYREKIVTDQSVEAIIAAKRKREFDLKHPDVVPTKKTLATDGEEVLEHALKCLTKEFDTFISACISVDGNPVAPPKSAVAKARACLPKRYTNSF